MKQTSAEVSVQDLDNKHRFKASATTELMGFNLGRLTVQRLGQQQHQADSESTELPYILHRASS